ncbi:MAG: ParB N-terminal domain-containing protein, partial [Chloroflexi bacterium]|nr:ParB N-terminal domain-containing protein [Chloroflexota bacterium]
MLEVKEINLTNLRAWENNPRLNDHAVDAVAESIRSFGFNVPILCDQNLTIIAGHTRWKAAKKLGMGKVPREGRNYMSKYHTDVWEIPAVTNQVEQFGHPAVC